ncbi:MAG: AMP-binding protein [Candidatus Dadabacteria bacterium]|nr:AMP-binding protein [Candidatus Dadabacteria bacterium]NIS07251.1 AMP-binding protein [Candidatus Dadabacteria bacterium]NIV40958.1 AMP-binding protein [Candidatus Dadabacteria bacterium]NIY21189.1 AMP-binding protein [Candidatus Dadabacteria bacterium]
MESSSTIPELLAGLTKKHKSRLLVQRRDGWSWKQITWLDFDGEVKNMASFLLSLGFESGDNVLVISSNSNECLVSELAVYSLGGTVIPFSSYELFSVFEQAVSKIKPKFIFVQNQQYLTQLEQNFAVVKKAKKIFIFDDSKVGDNENIVPYKAAVKFGQIKKKELSDKLKERLEEISPDQTALTIYEAKERETQESDYNHKEITQMLSKAYDRLKFISSEDQSYSYLITSELFEKLVHMLALCLGIRIIIAEDKDCFYEDILEAKPTILFETKSGMEDICNQLNGRGIKNMLGGRVKYLITDEEPDGKLRDKFSREKISIVSMPQFSKPN